jgi:hypothetical protein
MLEASLLLEVVTKTISSWLMAELKASAAFRLSYTTTLKLTVNRSGRYPATFDLHVTVEKRAKADLH